MKTASFIRIILAALLWSGLVAMSPQEKGRAIAEEMDRRDTGFVDTVADLTMVLADKGGMTAQRSLTIKTIEVRDADKGDKSMVVFHEPLDVRGTALLTHTGVKDADKQWLFLPAIDRVKRISSSNKAGPFVGSEFSYEDMLPPEIDKYTYEFIEDIPCGTLTCHVMERTPVDPDSGYQRQVAYVDTQEFRLQRVDYFDRRGDVLKTLFFTNYAQYQERFWRSKLMTMTNHQSGKSTQLIWGDFKFSNGFSSADFSTTALKR